ncbi:MAG: hypothetical protein AAGP08_18425, partial [Pseudomonadota bacterium]
AVEGAALTLGLVVEHVTLPFDPDASAPPALVAAKMQAVDMTIFLARLGDQIRFSGALGTARAIVSYALDVEMLGSPFSTADYQTFVQIKRLVDAAIAQAREVRVTCPAGTDFRGRLDRKGPIPADTNTIRFPQLVYTPVPAQGFSGRIAQQGFLVGTGSRFYSPYACALDETLFVEFEGTRRTGFSGAAPDVATAEAHYARVAEPFGIEDDFIHSWHGGIHPGCRFDAPAAASFERWGGSAFGNPRLLHVHTCGAYAPGEICLNIVDPTLSVDGIAVWAQGRLNLARVPGGAELLQNSPEVAAIFANPEEACGLGAGDRLSFH